MEEITVFGFGSLINSQSLKSTVPNAHALRSAYIKGFRRDFSVWDAEGWTETNLELAGEPYCALDIKKDAAAISRVNGVAFKLQKSDLQKLIDREWGYELIETTVYDYETNVQLGSCFVFSANKNDGAYTFGSKAQARYLEVCLDGAADFGERFYEEFLRSTFIDTKCLNNIPDLAVIGAQVVHARGFKERI